MSTSLRRSGAALLLALSLAACTEPGAEEASDPAASDPAASDPAAGEPSSSTPATEPSEETGSDAATTQQSSPIEVTGDAGVERAVVVSGSEVGGDVSPMAFPLETRQERRDFGAAFDRGFGGEVAEAARSLDAPAGTTTWGTVAAVACEGPTSVRIDAGEAGFEVTPTLPKGTVQCLVPVTYVVVFAAPSA